MTMASNAFNTYVQIGIKEQVSKIITNITPSETPAYSTIKKFKAENRLYEWQTDSLVAPANNANLEGDVVTVQTSTATTMLNNRTQISVKSLSVTDTSRAVSTYGRQDEYDYQIMKRGKEIKCDIEIGLLKNQAKEAGGTTTARVTAGLPAWITNLARGTAPSGDGSDTPDAGTGDTTAIPSTALLYAMIATAMTMAYQAGGSPSIMMLPPVLKRKFSELSLGATPTTAEVRYNVSSAKPAVAVGTVEQWLSDFGTVNVVPNRQMARVSSNMLNKAIFLIDPARWRMGTLQDMEIIPLAKRGLADEAFLRCEYVLEVSAPNAHAAIYNVTA